MRGTYGWPLIDAAHRASPRATGWLHNRLRMVVAMFLSKNLLLDVAPGRAFLHGASGGRRLCRQQRRLAVECIDRNRCGPVLPGLQSRESGRSRFYPGRGLHSSRAARTGRRG
ncbi:MAG: FAD-binding domain-containing protein [Gammaproteobacteria bacterium]|nr:FAD-binding domain-containing protein [Gammaproteobacteria bacterium]